MLAQQRDGVEDLRRRAGGDVGALADVRADGEEGGVEAALAHRLEDVVDLARSSSSVDAEVEDALRSRRRGRRAAAGSAGCRSASSRRRIGPASRIVDRVAEPREVVGGREPGGPGADDEHALARRRRVDRRPSSPALIASSPRKRSTELMPTASSSCAAVAGGLARVVADAPHHRRERVVLHDRAPGAPRSRPPRRGRATPGCSRRPGRRGCTAAGGRRRPGARCATSRSCWRRLEPTSSVIAKGLSIRPPRSSPKRAMLRSARAWMRAMTSVRGARAEQVRVAPLRPQVLLDRHLAADLRDRGDLAVARPRRPGTARSPWPAGRSAIVSRDGAAPAERAGHEHVQVARAAELHRALDLGLEVAQVGDRRGRDVGDLVRHRDQRHVLALAEDVAGLGRRPACVVAVRAAGGVAPERCTPVFM